MGWVSALMEMRSAPLYRRWLGLLQCKQGCPRVQFCCLVRTPMVSPLSLTCPIRGFSACSGIAAGCNSSVAVHFWENMLVYSDWSFFLFLQIRRCSVKSREKCQASRKVLERRTRHRPCRRSGRPATVSPATRAACAPAPTLWSWWCFFTFTLLMLSRCYCTCTTAADRMKPAAGVVTLPAVTTSAPRPDPRHQSLTCLSQESRELEWVI